MDPDRSPTGQLAQGRNGEALPLLPYEPEQDDPMVPPTAVQRAIRGELKRNFA